MTQDGPPPRHLHPVEPPHDPDYDRGDGGRRPPQDRGAEQAVLATLVYTPDAHHILDPELDSDDFFWPVHANLWDAWHHLHDTDGVPPDTVTLNAELIRRREADTIRLLADLAGSDANPALALQHARIVRDAARLRVVDQLATSLQQLVRTANTDKIQSHLEEGLQRLDETVTRFGATTAATAGTGLADMSWILTGAPPEVSPPIYGRRTDGTALFYAGRVNGLFGDPECGKTWIALIAGIEAMNQGHTFAMVDVDHNGQDHTAARLLLLGARPEHIADPDAFRYYEPQDADELRAAVVDITALAPAVVVLDSLGEMLPMLGVKSIDNDEITAALRTIAMPPAKAGSCVIHIDHLPKSVEARSTGYAIGGTAKKRATDGAYLRVEARQQPVPGGVGRATLRIEKDRTGALRKSSGGGYAGTFTLNSTQADVTTWTIGRDEMPTNADGSFRPTGYMEKVAHFVATNEGCSGRDIESGIAGTAKHIRSALTILVAEGHITRTPGPHRSWLHTLTIPYREAEDDNAQQAL